LDWFFDSPNDLVARLVKTQMQTSKTKSISKLNSEQKRLTKSIGKGTKPLVNPTSNAFTVERAALEHIASDGKDNDDCFVKKGL